MVDKWDHPIESVIMPQDTADEPTSNYAALMFVIWSAFMLAVGFFISLAVQGHIVLR